MIRESLILKISLPVLFLISFTLHFVVLNQTPYANGWDGYYYIMQVYTFLEEGAMHAPDYSPIYLYYVLLSFIIEDYILAYKIGSAILSGIMTASAFLITRSLTKDTFTACIIGTFFIFSPTLYFFASQFPKNLLGIIFLLWFMYFLSKKKMLWASIFFLLGFATHRMIAGISIIILIISFFGKLKTKMLSLVIVFAILLAFLLPGLIHITDIERFSNTISSNWYFPPLRFINFFGSEKLSIAWEIEILLLYFVFISFLGIQLFKFFKKREVDNFGLFLTVVLIVLSFPIYKFTRASIGFRFYIVFILLSILSLQYVIKLIPDKMKFALIGILILASVFSFKSKNSSEFDPPFDSYFTTMNNANSYLKGKNADLIIAHQTLAQIIIIYSDYNATNWQPVDTNRYESMWRITANIEYYYFKKYLNDDDLAYLKHLHHKYYLIREDKWQIFYKEASNSGDSNIMNTINSWYNPVNPKPDFLLKRRSKNYIH